MLPNPTADPAAANMNPIFPEKLPRFAIDLQLFGKIAVKPIPTKKRCIWHSIHGYLHFEI